MDPVEFARDVLAHPDEHDPETVREARLYLKAAPRRKAPPKRARAKPKAAPAPADISPDDAAFESAMVRRAR